METATIRRNRPSIVRIAAVALTLTALFFGRTGMASASGTPLRTVVADASADAGELWANTFARSGMSFATPDVYLVSEPTATSCGVLDADDLETYCAVDATIYLGVDELRSVRGDFGTYGVALVVADAYGFAVIDQLGHFGDPGTGAGASCLAGVWTWYADRDGELYAGAVADGAALYATFEGGSTLASAFLLGYNTDNINDCIPGGTGSSTTY